MWGSYHSLVFWKSARSCKQLRDRTTSRSSGLFKDWWSSCSIIQPSISRIPHWSLPYRCQLMWKKIMCWFPFHLFSCFGKMLSAKGLKITSKKLSSYLALYYFQYWSISPWKGILVLNCWESNFFLTFRIRTKYG